MARALLALVLLLTPLAGCGGGDDRDRDKPAEKAVDGTFVGKVGDTSAFVAVVAAPAAGKRDRRDVTVYVCDARRLCEWLSGSVSRNSFEATAEDRDADATGKLSAEAATGTVELPDGKTVRYNAARATGPAGLYDLTVSSDGDLSGASEAGVALKGTSTLPEAGRGTLKLADGRRLKFVVTRISADDPFRLRAGEARVIVLPGGQLRGAAKSRMTDDAEASGFFIRSSSK